VPTTPPRTLHRPDGTRLAYEVRTPPRPPASTVVLLHGLAGHRAEWDFLAASLTAAGHRTVTYDARGHGDSTRRPPTTTRAAHVADAAALITSLSPPPVTLVGQSLGGHTALLLAATHPHLVDRLVLLEAGPWQAPADLPDRIANWLDTWPVPFPTPAAATAFFGHEAWARSLEHRADGWWPRVDRDVMVESVRELTTRDHWPEWSRIRCPTLVIRGENGTMPEPDFHRMRTHPTAHCVTIPNAGHDVHLDQPAAVHETIEDFLKSHHPTPTTP
jgi:pimeloyl-ACP methyl ester carboxylesterase